MLRCFFWILGIGLLNCQLNAENAATVLYQFDRQLYLDNKQVFEAIGDDCLSYFIVGDSVTVVDHNTGVYTLENKNHEQISCKLFGRVESVPHFITKVMDGMILLSNGEIYVLKDIEIHDWIVRTPVLLVVTPEYWEKLIDLKTGASQYATSLGKLEWTKVVDEVIGHEGEYIVLKESGKFKAFSGPLGYHFFWQIGDKVYVKKFIESYVIGTTPPAELRFLYNATRGLVSVSIYNE